MTENFGGSDENNTYRIPRSSNAYLLVYIRESQWSALMEQVGTWPWVFFTCCFLSPALLCGESQVVLCGIQPLVLDGLPVSL